MIAAGKAGKVGSECVRRAGLADAEVLAGIHALCFVKPWDATSMATFLASPSCIALLAGTNRDNPPQGFLIAQGSAGEAEILTLAVLPECRGMGLGRALLASCVAALREAGTRQLFLEVDVGNAPARHLYASFGAVPVGRRKGYYEHGGDAAIFSLAL